MAFSYVLRLLPAGEKNLSAAGRVVMPQNRVKPVLATRNNTGLVSLTCAAPGVKIEYSIDGAEWKTYAEPFELLKGTVQVKAEGKDMISYQGAIVFMEPAAAKWNVTASSFEPEEGEPIHAIDEDPDTFWHSRYSGGVVKHPHFLVIDFKKPLDIAGVTYTARRDMANGRIKDYEIYFSNDPEKWGEPAARGVFRDRARRPQEVILPAPVNARYMKIVALSELTGQDFATIAEIGIIPAKANQ
jgi:beta-galactosidase